MYRPMNIFLKIIRNVWNYAINDIKIKERIKPSLNVIQDV